MAKRVIHECDLTKQEFNPAEDQVFTLTITKKGKRNPHKYELCAKAAEQLLAQLNGSTALPDGWSFQRDKPRAKTTLEDLEAQAEDDDTDERFVAEGQARLREAGVLDDREEPTEVTEVGKVLGVSKSKCPTGHMNKGPIQTTLRNNQRVCYRKCRDCGRQITEKTREEKDAYFGGKAPNGVRIRDI